MLIFLSYFWKNVLMKKKDFNMMAVPEILKMKIDYLNANIQIDSKDDNFNGISVLQINILCKITGKETK